VWFSPCFLFETTMHFFTLLAVLPLAFSIDFDTNFIDSDVVSFCVTSDSTCAFNDRAWSFVNTNVQDEFDESRVWYRLYDYPTASQFKECSKYQSNQFFSDTEFCKTCKPSWVYLLRLQKYVKSAEGKVEDVFFIDQAYQPTTSAWNAYCNVGGTQLLPALNNQDLVSDKSRAFYAFFASSTCYSTTFCTQASSVVPLESKVVCQPHSTDNYPSGEFCSFAADLNTFAITTEMGCDGENERCESVRFRWAGFNSRSLKLGTNGALSKMGTEKRGIGTSDLCVIAESSTFPWTWY